MCTISCLLGGLLEMVVGKLAETFINRVLIKVVDAVLDKMCDMWKRRKAAQRESSPDDAPRQDSSPAPATSHDDNVSMSDVKKEDASKDVVGSSSG